MVTVEIYRMKILELNKRREETKVRVLRWIESLNWHALVHACNCTKPRRPIPVLVPARGIANEAIALIGDTHGPSSL